MDYNTNMFTQPDHHFFLRLIGKHVVNFLSVLTELFSLGVMAEELQADVDGKSVFSLQQLSLPQISDRSCPHQKTRINDLSCGIRMWA